MSVNAPPVSQRRRMPNSKGMPVSSSPVESSDYSPMSTSSARSITSKPVNRTTSHPDTLIGNPNRRARYTPRTARRASQPPLQEIQDKPYSSVGSHTDTHTPVPQRQNSSHNQYAQGSDRRRETNRRSMNLSEDSSNGRSTAAERDSSGYAAPRRVVRGYEEGGVARQQENSGYVRQRSSSGVTRQRSSNGVARQQSHHGLERPTSRQSDRSTTGRVSSRQSDREGNSGAEKQSVLQRVDSRSHSRQLQRNERSASRQGDEGNTERLTRRRSSVRAHAAESKDDSGATQGSTRDRERYEAYYNKDGSRTPKALRKKKSQPTPMTTGTVRDEPESLRGVREITDRSEQRRSHSRNRRSSSPRRVSMTRIKPLDDETTGGYRDTRDARTSSRQEHSLSRQESRISVSRQSVSRQADRVDRDSRGRESKAPEESHRTGRRRESTTVVQPEEGRRNVFIAWSGDKHAKVQVTGSWDQWRRPIPLVWDFDQHYAVIDLRCGEYEYKFILDGVHTYDHKKPARDDWAGSYNNYFEI